MGKNKKPEKSTVGKSIINSLKKKEVVWDHTVQFNQPTEERLDLEKAKKLRSILEQNSLEEFLAEAQLSSKNFQAKRDIKMRQLKPELESKRLREVDVKQDLQLLPEEKEKVLARMRIPRKPKWTKQDTRDQYIQKQNLAFLDWRRKLAEVQESELHLKLTPFEKNIEVWKQLWRVVERSHILVQLVDVRDIMFYRCEDLEKYVREVDQNKVMLLLINKSDLANQEIRKQWAVYLNNHNINFVYFSAKAEQARVQENEEVKEFQINTIEIANTHQLVQAIKSLGKNIKTGEKNILEVGMVGYPNVGKSSVINSLLQKKKVGVASQPGKTKHYQTLFLTPEILLVDCPGLVFPNVASSIAQMVLNGVVLIDTIKDHTGPMQLMVNRVPKRIMCMRYGVKFSQGQPYTSEVLLRKYATLRGFFGTYGNANQSMAARLILKEYTSGIIKFCCLPPGCEDVSKFQHYLDEQQQSVQGSKPQLLQEQNKKIVVSRTQQGLDGVFFAQQKEVSSMEDIVKLMTMQDLVDLVDGKMARGIKLPKELKREIKFAIRRGQTLDAIKSKYLLQGKVVDSGHQKMIKV